MVLSPLPPPVMNVITVEDYKRLYWPKLESAIEQLLTQTAGDYIPISYEQIYRCVSRLLVIYIIICHIGISEIVFVVSHPDILQSDWFFCDGDLVLFSCSCVYKCVCQQHSEQMYSDLLCKITQHLHQVSQELQVPCHTHTTLSLYATLL